MAVTREKVRRMCHLVRWSLRVYVWWQFLPEEGMLSSHRMSVVNSGFSGLHYKIKRRWHLTRGTKSPMQLTTHLLSSSSWSESQSEHEHTTENLSHNALPKVILRVCRLPDSWHLPPLPNTFPHVCLLRKILTWESQENACLLQLFSLPLSGQQVSKENTAF